MAGESLGCCLCKLFLTTTVSHRRNTERLLLARGANKGTEGSAQNYISLARCNPKAISECIDYLVASGIIELRASDGVFLEERGGCLQILPFGRNDELG